MLDDSDLDFALLSSPSGGGAVGCLCALVWLVLVIVIAVIVAGNKEDCAQMHCPDGQTPKLMAHECLCVTKAAEPRR